MGGAATAEAPAATRASALPSLLIVSSRQALRVGLATESARRGMRAVFGADAADVGVQANRGEIAAAVVDLALPDPYAVLRALDGVPVLAVGGGDELADRIAVAEAGAHGQLDARASYADMIDQVALMVERSAITGATVLVLDPDPVTRAAVTAELDRFDVRSLDSADALWHELARTQPALLVLAGQLGAVGVGNLCRVLRSDPRWTAVPIVVMAAEGEAVAPIFAAGATDCLSRLEELSVRASSHVERYRLHQALAETDALTGLANRRTSTAALGQLIRLAERLVEPLCLAQIDLDHFKAINDRYGHLSGDEVLRRLSDVLRRTLRREDVIARWGGEEFVIGMLGLSRNEGVDRMTDVLAAFRGEEIFVGDHAFRVTFSGGVAQFPADGDTLEALYEAADAALYSAKSAGRNQVAAARSPDGSTQQTVDVAVIEDDDSTAKLISIALTDAGMKWWRYSNGAGALQSLSGEYPSLRARVILLDLDLPAISGTELLGVLQRDGILEATKVFCVTGSDDPAAEERLRGLGATEYVRKPFMIDDLVRRVQTALGR